MHGSNRSASLWLWLLVLVGMLGTAVHPACETAYEGAVCHGAAGVLHEEEHLDRCGIPELCEYLAVPGTLPNAVRPVSDQTCPLPSPRLEAAPRRASGTGALSARSLASPDWIRVPASYACRVGLRLYA